MRDVTAHSHVHGQTGLKGSQPAITPTRCLLQPPAQMQHAHCRSSLAHPGMRQQWRHTSSAFAAAGKAVASLKGSRHSHTRRCLQPGQPASWPGVCAAAHRLIMVCISDEAHELSAEQGAAAHLVGQQMGHGLGQAAMHQDVGVQAASQQGLTVLQGEAVTSAHKYSLACDYSLCSRCGSVSTAHLLSC